MKNEANLIEVMGTELLKCQQEDCEWNVGWLGGYEWTEKPGKGTRVCNLGAKAMIETKAMPPADCQQPSAVIELARSEFEI